MTVVSKVSWVVVGSKSRSLRRMYVMKDTPKHTAQDW